MLVQLGVDGPEAGERHAANSATTLHSSPSWEYFQLLSLGLQVFDRLTSEAEVAILFLTRSLGLDAVVERLVGDLRKTSPRLLRQHILIHYLLSVSSEQEKVSADEYTPPYPWESLTSVLMRIAGKKAHTRLEWLLSSVGISDVFQLFREDPLLLRRKGDYDMFAQQFSLSRQALYTLTLHRFAPLLQPPESTGQPLLSEKTAARYFMPHGTTKVCPVCLAEEPEAFERLYWDLRSVLICPRHLIFLIDRCPNCNCLIPTQVRSSITYCPYCHNGDYRAAVPVTLAQDSFLYTSQLVLLRFLGVEETTCRDIPWPFHGSPLAGLLPWQYFSLLDHFSVVAPYLQPERILSAFCRSMGFPEEPAAYQQHDQKQMAVQISLFHALFVSWPSQVFAILGSGADSPRLGEPDDEVYLFLRQVFEERRKYGQQAAWQRQTQQASALAREGRAT